MNPTHAQLLDIVRRLTSLVEVLAHQINTPEIARLALMEASANGVLIGLPSIPKSEFEKAMRAAEDRGVRLAKADLIGA